MVGVSIARLLLVGKSSDFKRVKSFGFGGLGDTLSRLSHYDDLVGTKIGLPLFHSLHVSIA